MPEKRTDFFQSPREEKQLTCWVGESSGEDTATEHDNDGELRHFQASLKLDTSGADASSGLNPIL